MTVTSPPSRITNQRKNHRQVGEAAEDDRDRKGGNERLGDTPAVVVVEPVVERRRGEDGDDRRNPRQTSQLAREDGLGLGQDIGRLGEGSRDRGHSFLTVAGTSLQ